MQEDGRRETPNTSGPDTYSGLRSQVREFLTEARERGAFEPQVDGWMAGHSPEFSRELGRRGWLGMTWPERYGGHERGAAERFCVMEELLAAGAPVAAHWIADRQIGPSLLRNGTEEQRKRFLPAMAAGEEYFCLGLSEPDSGSDLASVRTTATRRDDRAWTLRGAKLWTSGAHLSHHMLTLCRSTPSSRRHEGLTQFIVDMSAPGVTVRPILLLNGEHHFNEVILDEVIVPDSMVVGAAGEGWRQVTAELADERSGPERYMSTLPMLLEFAATREAGGTDGTDGSGGTRGTGGNAVVGRIAAELWSVRALSRDVAALIDQDTAGQNPAGRDDLELRAALAKDAGTEFEHRSIEAVRRASPVRPEPGSALERLLDQSVAHSPGFSLRGGTTEILRSVIAKKLGI